MPSAKTELGAFTDARGVEGLGEIKRADRANGAAMERAWRERFEAYRSHFPHEADELARRLRGELRLRQRFQELTVMLKAGRRLVIAAILALVAVVNFVGGDDKKEQGGGGGMPQMPQIPPPQQQKKDDSAQKALEKERQRQANIAACKQAAQNALPVAQKDCERRFPYDPAHAVESQKKLQEDCKQDQAFKSQADMNTCDTKFPPGI